MPKKAWDKEQHRRKRLLHMAACYMTGGASRLRQRYQLAVVQ